MNKSDVRIMQEKIDTYKGLVSNLESLKLILEMPKKINEKYNSSEKTSIVVAMTYGNGSDKEEIRVVEGSITYKVILKELTQQQIRLENEIKIL